MTHSEKPVSVIIPYDIDRGFLNKAILSVAEQTVGCELVVFQGANWLSVNLNKAIQKCTGEYIKILAEDDLLTPNSISDLYEGIQGYDWVCADAIDFDETNHELYRKGHKPKLKEMIVRNCIHGGSVMYRKDIIYEVGGWDECLWTGEEYDLHLKLLSEGYRLNYIPKVVYRYRIHEQNKSTFVNEISRPKRQKYIRNIALRYDNSNNTL